MDSFPQSMSRSSLAGSENILRIGRGDQPANDTFSSGDLTRKGQAALDMVHQVAETISAMENQIEGRLVQSLEKIKVAEDLSRALEARAVQAESRALEAEKWLRRVHNAMQDKISARLRAQSQDSAA